MSVHSEMFVVTLHCAVCCFSTDLQNTVATILTTVSQVTVKAVSDKLRECGVESLDDLKYVVEGDLSGVLKPIQIRKLLSAWKHEGDVTFSAITCSSDVSYRSNKLHCHY